MNSAKEVFRNFVGTWAIRRVLGTFGRAEGIAKFTPSSKDYEGASNPDPISSSSDNGKSQSPPPRLMYREEVDVTYLDGQFGAGGSAHQEYLYEYDEAGDKIVMKFTDGRHFYDLNLDLELMEGQGEHLCEKDLYKAKYRFGDLDHFYLAYDVQGPQKDYVIETFFERKKEGEGP